MKPKQDYAAKKKIIIENIIKEKLAIFEINTNNMMTIIKGLLERYEIILNRLDELEKNK